MKLQSFRIRCRFIKALGIRCIINVAQFRDLVYYGQFPGPRIFWGGWLIAFIMLFVGIWSFQRSKDKFILYI